MKTDAAPATPSAPVSVVGAGIAGLTAAFRLKQAGFAVRVLEADDHVGGRMSTMDHRDCRIDLAASIFPTTYKRMLPLIEDAGLTGEVEPTSDLVGIIRDGKPHRTRSHSKLDGVRTDLLSARGKLAMVRAMFDAMRAGARLSWDDLGEAAAWDGESAAQYARRRLNEEVLAYIVDPACRAVCLLPPDRVSAVDFLFAIRNVLGGALFNSSTGADFLPKGLARQLDVQLNTPVTSVREVAGEVEVTYAHAGEREREERVAACVIAVPAPHMLEIYQTLDPARRKVAEGMDYAVAVGLHFGLSKKPVDEPAVLLQVPRTEHPDLSAIILDHNKAPGRVREGGGLLATYWQHDWGVRQWDRDDAAIAEDGLAALRQVMPGLARDVAFTHVQRWRHGFTKARVGSYRERVGFRDGGALDARVQLAGDYFSSSSTHSSLCAGEVAAARIAAALGRRGTTTSADR